jgi:Zn-dependent protease with chaperone function
MSGMLERLTDGSKTVLRLAAGHMREAGRAQVDTADLLLGLIDEGGAAAVALAEGGVTAARVREQAPSSRAIRPAAEAAMLAEDARRALESATRHAIAMSYHDVGPDHLLLGIISVPDGAACSVLGALGVDLGALDRSARDRVVEPVRLRAQAPGLPARPDAATTPPPIDLPALGAPPPLPAGRAAALWHAAIAPVHLLLAVAVVALSPAALRPAVSVAAVGVPLLMYALSRMLRPVALRQARGRASRGPRVVPVPAGPLADALRPCGVAELEVYASDEALMRNFAYGMGAYGFIRLARVTLQIPEVGRFVVAHEAGHLAGRDTLRLVAVACMVEGLVVGGLIGARPAALVVALLGALALRTGVKWAVELRSDAIAVRWAGLPAAMAWYGFHRAAYRAEKRTPRWYLRHSLAWLQHPPLSLRRRFWSRVAQARAAPVGIVPTVH